jgi:hypothetical protein
MPMGISLTSVGSQAHDLAILPRQGEVAGASQTEGEARDVGCSVSSPSVACGATSPWRGRIATLPQRHPSFCWVTDLGDRWLPLS